MASFCTGEKKLSKPRYNVCNIPYASLRQNACQWTRTQCQKWILLFRKTKQRHKQTRFPLGIKGMFGDFLSELSVNTNILSDYSIDIKCKEIVIATFCPIWWNAMRQLKKMRAYVAKSRPRMNTVIMTRIYKQFPFWKLARIHIFILNTL